MNLHPYLVELGPATVMIELSRYYLAQGGDSLGKRQLDEPMNGIPELPFWEPSFGESIRKSLQNSLLSLSGLHKKRKLILAGQELCLLEEIVRVAPHLEVHIAVESTMPEDVFQRIAANIPSGLNARPFRGPVLTGNFNPKDTLLVAVGFEAGLSWAMLMQESLRTLSSIKPYFLGDTLLLVPYNKPIYTREACWATVEKARFFMRRVA